LINANTSLVNLTFCLLTGHKSAAEKTAVTKKLFHMWSESLHLSNSSKLSSFDWKPWAPSLQHLHWNSRWAV